jgi:hypothetical protein
VGEFITVAERICALRDERLLAIGAAPSASMTISYQLPFVVIGRASFGNPDLAHS